MQRLFSYEISCAGWELSTELAKRLPGFTVIKHSIRLERKKIDRMVRNNINSEMFDAFAKLWTIPAFRHDIGPNTVIKLLRK